MPAAGQFGRYLFLQYNYYYFERCNIFQGYLKHHFNFTPPGIWQIKFMFLFRKWV